MSVEVLEPRIALASVLTFTDIDGDHVIVTASSGDIIAATHSAGLGVQIESIDATGAPGADLIVSVGKASGGDGFVNIGQIDAHGVALGRVIVPGDLGRILVGTGVDGTLALTSLKVSSLGRFGVTTGALDNVSTIGGAVGFIDVEGDVAGAEIDDDAGGINEISIGSSLLANALDGSGSIYFRHDIGSVEIHGDVIGGKGKDSGQLFTRGNVGSLYVGGSILSGDNGHASGVLYVQGNLDMATINGSLRRTGLTDAADFDGGDYYRAILYVGGNLGELAIAGSIDGGKIDVRNAIDNISIGGNLSGLYFNGGLFDDEQAIRTVHGAISSLTIKGSMMRAARVQVGTDLDSLTVEKNLDGVVSAGGAIESATVRSDLGGSLTSEYGMGSIVIKGNLRGFVETSYGSYGSSPSTFFVGGSIIGGAISIGNFDVSGSIYVHGSVRPGKDGSGGDIYTRGFDSIFIGGSLIGGDRHDSGSISVAGDIKSIVVRGSVRGGAGESSGSIENYGGTTHSVKIGGSLIGGSGEDSGEIILQRGGGSIRIGGSVIGGSGNSFFGTISGAVHLLAIHGDLIGGAGARSGSIYARIDHIEIGGSIRAGDAALAGSIRIDGSLSILRVHGDIAGSEEFPEVIAAFGYEEYGEYSQIVVPGSIGLIAVGGDVSHARIRAGIDASGLTPGEAHIGTVRIGGDWTSSELSSGFAIDKVRIGGDWTGSKLRSGFAIDTVRIDGDVRNSHLVAGSRIGLIDIRGSVAFSSMAAGFDGQGNPLTGSAQIGTITVRGDWTASSLLAGVGDGGDGQFGDQSDTLNPGGEDSRIGSVTIFGAFREANGDGSDSVIESHEIGSVRVSGYRLQLDRGAVNDAFLYPLGNGSNFILREI